MLGEGREPRKLNVSSPIQTVLALLRAQANITGRTELDVDKVHEVESAFAVRFSDDILAVFAAKTPPLSDRYGVVIAKVIAHTGAMLRCRGARGDLVAIGKSETNYICVEKLDRSQDFVLFSPEKRQFSTVSVAEWLAQFVDAASKLSPRPFQPSLYKVPPMSSSGQRVRHSKFGEGLLLCEIGTGPTRKVKVDFPGVGLKVIQARFLEGLDP